MEYVPGWNLWEWRRVFPLYVPMEQRGFVLSFLSWKYQQEEWSVPAFAVAGALPCDSFAPTESKSDKPYAPSKKKRRHVSMPPFRAVSQTWTGDLRVTNALLYQLSYNGIYYRFAYGVQRYGFIWNYQTKVRFFSAFSELSFCSLCFSLGRNLVTVSTQFRAFPFERALFSALNRVLLIN